jgi:3',5'-cyclic AMP phosphodiesterase CpdA
MGTEMVARLAFIHASDLHIDRQTETNGFSFIGGFQTHDIQLCIGFVEAIKNVRLDLAFPDTEPLHLAVSGDLTASGRTHDFTAAHTYLRSHWRRKMRGSHAKVGLELAENLVETIPGNHDHWDGRRLPGQAYRPRAVAAHFKRTPYRAIWTDVSRQIELEIFGIDSNSGLTTPISLGQGSIAANELIELDKLLARNPKPAVGVTRVRVIMLHHSLTYRGGRLFPRVISPLVLDRQSVSQLTALSLTHGVRVLLTGHTHDAGHFDLRLPPNSLRELRCPTTLQGPAVKLGAGFFVHQIEKGSATYWETWHYVWDGSEFRPNPTLPLVRFSVD